MNALPRLTKMRRFEHTTDGDAIIDFSDKDGGMHRIEIDAELVSKIIDELQDARRQTRKLLTLTVMSHQTVASAESKGLAFETREMGTIAFLIPQQALPGLRVTLANLEAMPTPEDTPKQ
jgi:hypothetical protein